MKIHGWMAAGALLLLAAAGCAGTEERLVTPPDVLYGQAATAVEEKEYEKAEALIRQVREDHPFSPYAVEAELLQADMFYQKEEYESAAAAYRAFEELHPGHPKAEYALYRRGLCYAERMSASDRDQTATREMVSAFTRLLGAYPQGQYAEEARSRVAEGRLRLARHEMEVARYYLRKEKYDAALERLRYLAAEYADTPLRDEALKLALEVAAEKDRAGN